MRRRPGAHTRPVFGSTEAHFVGYVRCMIFPQSIRQGDTGRCDQNGLSCAEKWTSVSPCRGRQHAPEVPVAKALHHIPQAVKIYSRSEVGTPRNYSRAPVTTYEYTLSITMSRIAKGKRLRSIFSCLHRTGCEVPPCPPRYNASFRGTSNGGQSVSNLRHRSSDLPFNGTM